MFDYIWLVPVFPAIGVLINGLLGRRIEAINKSLIHWIACGMIALSFIVTCIIFFQLQALPAAERIIQVTCLPWINSGVLQTNIAYLIDPLSMMMAMFVIGIGFLIHVYSIGYMDGDPGRYYRFFVYLNLFMFSMINLVLANNFLLLFLGWEGVGLCSYLLIGFWFDDEANAIAGKKAFITNRVGDFAFLIGLFLLFTGLGEHGIWTLQFNEVFSNVHYLSTNQATAICLLFFIGCTAKSAQIPLYVWLPDAMAGPTPVSALIHAATMVTSGVYLISRCNILFSMSPFAMGVVATVGALTALFAASIGLVQNDIKKVLAYSTVSQLGYMFLAYHKVHSHDDAQDMRNMGGLKDKTPVTFWTFLAGTIAIAGIPGFSGFFSKDEILWKAYSSPQGHWLLWLIGVIAAGMTAFYMFRLLFMTFFNECRAGDAAEYIHDSPKTMLVPLCVLAFLAAVGGYLGVPHILGGNNLFHHFLEPVMGLGDGKLLQDATTAVAHGAHQAVHAAGHAVHAAAGHAVEAAGHHGAAHHPPLWVEWMLMIISVAIASFGILVAYIMYIKKRDIPVALAEKYAFLHRLLLNKWYVDELYDIVIISPLRGFSYFLWKGVDVGVIDGIVNGVARIVGWGSSTVRYMQSGYVQSYAISVVFGTVVLLAYYFAKAL